MTVIRNAADAYDVVENGGIVQAGFATSSAAWRWIDRRTLEPLSPAERRVDWLRAQRAEVGR